MNLIVHYPGDLPTADHFRWRRAADLGVDVGVVGAERGISLQVDLLIGELGIGSPTGGRITDPGDDGFQEAGLPGRFGEEQEGRVAILVGDNA